MIRRRRFIVVAFGASILASSAAPLAQQSQARQITFRVVSVKPNKDGGPLTFGIQGSRFVATNIPVRLLIQRAYSTPNGGLLPGQVVGGPAWIDSARFDIDARLDDSRSLRPDDVMTMVRSMLEDRFQLETHSEPRRLPVFNLAIGKNGSKMTPASDQSPTTRPAAGSSSSRDPGAPPGRGIVRVIASPVGTSTVLTVTADAISVSRATSVLDQPTLANLLQSYAGRPVLDKTGLEGLFDVRLRFVLPLLSASPDAGAADTGAPSLFTAVEEQLGLTLEAGTDSVDVLVIDRIERPAAN